MENQKFIPEGWQITNENWDIATLNNAMQRGDILQGFVTNCDENYNLYLNFGDNIKGIIPKNEIDLSSNLKNSIYTNKKNTLVQFKVKEIVDNQNVILSRKLVKQDALKWVKNELNTGDIVYGIVRNIRPYGAFIEIGGGVVGLLHIEDISVSRMKSPDERLTIGEKINVVVKEIEKETGKVVLSYKELLGDWDENVKELEEKSIVDGIIKEADKYKNGIFVELKPNLVGMAEYKEGFEYGQRVKVLIRKIIKNKKKIKLVIV